MQFFNPFPLLLTTATHVFEFMVHLTGLSTFFINFWHSEGKFVDFSGKGTFKLVRLLSLKRFVENYKRYSSSKSWNFNRCLYGREHNLAPPKLASLLILKCFFQWCQWIFLNLSMSKAEKTSGHVYSQTSTNSHPSTLGTSLQQPLFLSRRDNDSCLKGLCHGSPVHFV